MTATTSLKRLDSRPSRSLLGDRFPHRIGSKRLLVTDPYGV